MLEFQAALERNPAVDLMSIFSELNAAIEYLVRMIEELMGLKSSS